MKIWYDFQYDILTPDVEFFSRQSITSTKKY